MSSVSSGEETGGDTGGGQGTHGRTHGRRTHRTHRKQGTDSGGGTRKDTEDTQAAGDT